MRNWSVLDQGLSDKFQLTGDETVEIYDSISVSVLSEAAKNESCTILSLREQEESLESFYLNVVGGDRHA